MLRITHAIAGAAMGVMVAVLFQQDVVLFTVVGGLFGTVPDLDIHFEKAGVAKHRGIWSHSLLSSMFLAGFCFALWYLHPNLFPFWLWLVVFSATWMHTAADSLTRSGTHLFYPLSKKRFRGPAKYDSLVANILVIGTCAVLVFLLLNPETASILNTFLS